MMISEPNETDTMGQKKLSGMDFFTRTLGAPKYVVIVCFWLTSGTDD